MSRRRLIIIWILGFILCIEKMVIFAITESPYAFVASFIILASLYFLKDRDGNNIYILVRRSRRKDR